MTSCFVTCLYNGLHHTKICGRLNRNEPYKYSLETISNIKTDIKCYTSPKEKPSFVKYFNMDKKITNIEFIEKDLYSLYFHKDVDKIRDSNNELYRKSPGWNNRCIEIMWGKFLFIKECIENNPNLKYIFWIDAGISHSGIIHSRFNPHYEHNIKFVRDLDKSTYPITFKNDLIFNSEFTKLLIKYTGDDSILNIISNNPQNPRINIDNSINNVFKGSPIGGLFGGNTILVKKYCDRIIELFEKLTSSGILCKEEQLMTEVLAAEEFQFKTFSFDTWYHPDWIDHYKEFQIQFSDFFDEIKK